MKKGGKRAATKKASFKVNGAKKGGLKAGNNRGNSYKAEIAERAGVVATEYKGYDISDLPEEARPQPKKKLGAHSYTVVSRDSEATIEVLVRSRAFFVKKISPGHDGPKGQVSFSKFGGPKEAWTVAKQRAGFTI